MNPISTLVATVGDLLRLVPVKYRARVYEGFAFVAGFATLAVLLFSNGDLIGVDFPSRWTAIATGIAAIFGALAAANTDDTEV